MNGKLYAKVDHRRAITYVKLAGIVDEDNHLEELFHPVYGNTIVIDLGDVARINSCGVRDWLNWLARLEEWRVSVVLRACSPAIVSQLNIVRNFARGAMVKSFYAPYFCTVCEAEKLLLLDVADLDGCIEAPVCHCDECDRVMVFDSLPEVYFNFLTERPSFQRRARRPTPGLKAVPAPPPSPSALPPEHRVMAVLSRPAVHVLASALVGVIAALSYLLVQ